jgi:hypothetical protein
VNARNTGTGAIFPVACAARLVGLDTNTARRWVRGYTYTHKCERKQAAPAEGKQILASLQRHPVRSRADDYREHDRLRLGAAVAGQP